jgi:hypothetical protein
MRPALPNTSAGVRIFSAPRRSGGIRSVFLATHGKAVRGQCRELLESVGYCIQSLDGASFEDSDEFLAFAPD